MSARRRRALLPEPLIATFLADAALAIIGAAAGAVAGVLGDRAKRRHQEEQDRLERQEAALTKLRAWVIDYQRVEDDLLYYVAQRITGDEHPGSVDDIPLPSFPTDDIVLVLSSVDHDLAEKGLECESALRAFRRQVVKPTVDPHGLQTSVGDLGVATGQLRFMLELPAG
jgi:hypothetical protein